MRAVGTNLTVMGTEFSIGDRLVGALSHGDRWIVGLISVRRLVGVLSHEVRQIVDRLVGLMIRGDRIPGVMILGQLTDREMVTTITDSGRISLPGVFSRTDHPGQLLSTGLLKLYLHLHFALLVANLTWDRAVKLRVIVTVVAPVIIR